MHDASKALMGSTSSSMKEVTNYPTTTALEAGLVAHLKSDETVTKAKGGRSTRRRFAGQRPFGHRPHRRLPQGSWRSREAQGKLQPDDRRGCLYRRRRRLRNRRRHQDGGQRCVCFGPFGWFRRNRRHRGRLVFRRFAFSWCCSYRLPGRAVIHVVANSS
jgi:hypothetical protein